MSEDVDGCPGDEALQNLIAGAGDAEELERVEEHVGDCQACAARLEELAGATEFEEQFSKPAAPGAHESVELTQLIDHLKASVPPAVAIDGEGGGGRRSEIIERFPAGAMLDGYRVEGLIARGGMGVVLKAFDSELERSVAIKLLDPGRFSGVESGERFLREARAAAAIDHENVLPIFTVGQKGELPYLVMPYVEGETLQDRVDREGALAPEEVVRISKAVARGLDAAHSVGLVHRDIKPANILLEPDGGRVWIADFGLARAAEETSITHEGVIAGTPQFMSPEQAGGKEADQRSDLFSFGAIMYFMLAGRPPFSGDSSLTVLRQVADSSPAWTGAEVARAPSSLRQVARQLLEKSPERRPESAAAVVEALELGQGSASRAHWRWFVGGAIVVATIIALFVLSQPDPTGASALPVVARIDDSDYSSLADALAAAGEGDIVEIVSTAPIDTEALSPITSAITIRAGEGVQVELFRDDLGGPVLEVGGRVTLEGIKFWQPLLIPNRENEQVDDDVVPPLLLVSGAGEVSLSNCSLMRARPGKGLGKRDGVEGGPPVCIEVQSAARLEMKASVLASAASAGVAVHAGGRAELTECLLGCEFAVVVARPSEGSDPERTHVSLRSSAVVGIATLVISYALNSTPVEVELESNCLLSVGTVLWTRGSLVASNLSVKAGGNLYTPLRGFGVVGVGGEASGQVLPRRVSIGSFDEWRAFAGETRGSSIELDSSEVMRLIRKYRINNVHPAPEFAVERVSDAIRELRQRYPEIGCDVDGIGRH
jgi:serine/threonine-protein kinase